MKTELKWTTLRTLSITRSKLKGKTFCEIEKYGKYYVGAIICLNIVVDLTVAKTLHYCKRKCETRRRNYEKTSDSRNPAYNPYFCKH